MGASYSSLWPQNFDPEHPGAIAAASVVGDLNRTADPAALHRHANGQLALCLQGAAGLELADGFCAIPPRCAVWLPPHMLHNGVLGEGAKTIYLMVSPKACQILPRAPKLFMLNPMTVTMLEHFAGVYRSADDCEQARLIVKVILGELACARTLPVDFSPMPKSPQLRKIAIELLTPQGKRFTNTEWAHRCAMSERTLSRRVTAETGMSFRAWRQRTLFLAGIGALMSSERVEVVADQMGYGTPSAFIAAFRNLFGCSPGRYRDQQLSRN